MDTQRGAGEAFHIQRQHDEAFAEQREALSQVHQENSRRWSSTH